MKLRVLTLLLLLCLIAAPTHAFADNVMNFASATFGSFLTGDYEEDGILMHLQSPGGTYYDIITAPYTAPNPPSIGYVQLDSFQVNTDIVRISLVSGQSFDLDSIQFFMPGMFDLFGGLGYIISSNGTKLNVIGGETISFSSSIGFSDISYFDVEAYPPPLENAIWFSNVEIAAIPEPSTWLLLASGLAGIVAMKKRFPRNQRAALH